MTEFQLAVILGCIRVNNTFEGVADFLKRSKLISFNFEYDPEQMELFIVGFVNCMSLYDHVDIFKDDSVYLSRFARTFIPHHGDISFVREIKFYKSGHPETLDEVIKYFEVGIGYTYPSEVDYLIEEGLNEK